ncbi:MAG: nitroreductase family protein [Planctomycetota bacterium]
MDRPAPVAHPIHELLARRWSPRAFDARPVEPEKLRSLLEAARWAPSSFNEQPWSYLVATKGEAAEFARMLECLVEANRLWAKEAPVLMLAVASLRFARNGKENRHAFHDVGLATGNLVVQATGMGLYVHQMAGILPEAARAAYAIPEGHEAATGIALGYPGDPASLPEKFRAAESAERTRKPLEAFVFAGRWGARAPLLGG